MYVCIHMYAHTHVCMYVCTDAQTHTCFPPFFTILHHSAYQIARATVARTTNMSSIISEITSPNPICVSVYIF